MSSRYGSTLFPSHNSRISTALVAKSLRRQTLVGRYFYHYRYSKCSYTEADFFH